MKAIQKRSFFNLFKANKPSAIRATRDRQVPATPEPSAAETDFENKAVATRSGRWNLYEESNDVTPGEEMSKHRMKLPMYDIQPYTEQNWIAPSATIIGEVSLKRNSSVWYNAVIRGDINSVTIHNFTSIGDNTVLHTAPSLPTGQPAKLTIANNCTIGANCTLYSCKIGHDVMIGDKCTILEGAVVEDAAQLLPGSVVPPGRLIPTKQLWGGNPVQFIKDLDIQETWSNYSYSYVIHYQSQAHKNEFTPWNSAYL